MLSVASIIVPIFAALGATLVSSWLIIFILRQRASHGALPMAALIGIFTIWCDALALQTLNGTLDWMLLWVPLIEASKAAVGGAFLTSCIEYTRRRADARFGLLLILLPAILSYGLALTNDWHRLWYADARLVLAVGFPAIDLVPQVLKRIQQLYSFSAFLVGITMLIWTYRRASGVKRRSLGLSVVGAILICLALLLARIGETIFRHPTPPQLELLLIVTAPLLLAYGLTHLPVLRLLPIARDRILQELHDGIIVIDASAIVVDLNAAAARIFGLREHELMMRSITEIYPAWPASLAGPATVETITQISIEQALERRVFEVHSLPLAGLGAAPIGAVIRLTDITSHQRAEADATAALLYERRLAELSQALSNADSLSSLLDDTLRIAAELVDTDMAVLLLLDYDGATVTEQRVRSRVVPPVDPALLPRELSPAFVQLISGGRPLLINEYAREAHALPTLVDIGIRSQLILPIPNDGQIGGLLTLMRQQNSPQFSNRDLQILAPLPQQFGAALARIRRNEVERQRYEELQALQATFTDIAAHLELEPLLQIILHRIVGLFDADGGLISQYVRSTHSLALWASYHLHPEIADLPPPKIGEGLVGMVAATRRPLIVNDLRQWEKRRPILPTDALPNAAIAVPLLHGDELVGVLTVVSQRTFKVHDQQLMLLFAQQATIAIQNARLYATIRRLAQTDDLTGAWNRRHFLHLADHEHQRALRYPAALTIALLDLDHFKSVNDLYGHQAGDRVLTALVERCHAMVRQVDIVGRYGGEEFAICLPETDLAGARQIAERLRHAIATTPCEVDGAAIHVTASIGLAWMPAGSSATLDTLLDRADQALYAAKRGGRNQVWFWDQATGALMPSEPSTT